MNNNPTNTNNFVCVGVDFGGDSCRVSVLDKNDKITLHVNRVSNRQTPTLVSFDKRTRIYGEEAEARSSTLFKHTVPLLSYVVGLDKHQLLQFIKSKKYLFFSDFNEEDGSFNVTFDDAPLSVLPCEVYSFFLNKVLDTVRQEFNLSPDNEGLYLSLGVPSYFSEEFKERIHKSLLIANIKRVKLFNESQCILKRWADAQLSDLYQEYLKTRNEASGDGTNDMSIKIGFLDVGFAHTTFFVAEVVSEDTQLSTNILSELSSDMISTYKVVEALCDHVKGLIEAKGSKVDIPSRQSYYLYKSCVKCVKELSVLNDAKLDVERVMNNDEDFSTNVTRNTLEQLVKTVEDNLCSLIDEVIGKTDRKNFMSIEILGGGSRIPFVKNVAIKYAEALGCVKGIRTSLDTTSAISYGATKLLKDYLVSGGVIDGGSDGATSAVTGTGTTSTGTVTEDEELLELIKKEKYMQEVENEQMLKMTTLNEIDNYLIRTKSDLLGGYKNHFEDKHEDVEKVLQELETFSYNALNDKTVTSRACQDELKLTQEKLYELAPKYKEKLEEDLRKIEASKISNNANMGNEEGGSYNNININGTGSKIDSLAESDVVLPNKTCIKRAQKNKDEGNELIGAGNIELAIQHYVKVLQYCGKVNSPNEEEKETINGLRLASNLNLAMCYLKLDVPASLNKAVSCCTSALSISPENTKALFRRAVAYEKLNDFDNALNDAKRGCEIDSGNQDFKNMCDRVDRKIKLQLQKQKKGGSRYDKKINRLTDRVKYAIFFAHTATKRSFTTLGSSRLCNSKETVLDSSPSNDLDNCSDSTHSYTTNQINGVNGLYVSGNDSIGYLTIDQGSVGDDGSCVSDGYLDEYEDVDEFEDITTIMRSTRRCRDELVNKLNTSFNKSADVKLLYSLSPIDFRINSLKSALSHLNNMSVTHGLL
ncbi:hypothetical protein MACK_000428 [Theileria orientalis]|uniref:Uncharacterized protein n=1 Tax=Theileria orientalis TaxID=68886 RepID=A0A976M9M3_THEOR|nr:hypothetical protein MACK_000428 [Theileria orientalis]